MDPEAAVSGNGESLEVQRARLVARAAAEREALSKQLEPFSTLEGTLERLSVNKREVLGTSLGMGLGLSALLLALPAGQTPIVRGGLALFNLASSVRTFFKRR